MSELDDKLRETVEGWNLETKYRIALVTATKAKEIADLEARFGITQQDAIRQIVEQSGWGMTTFPQYQERPGSFQEEFEALRSNWEDYIKITENPYDYETIKQQMELISTSAIEDWERVTRQCTHLVKATDPKQIAALEALFGITQENAVVHFVEQTEWGMEAFPQYQDRRGSFQERLEALRSKWADWEAAL